MQSSNNSIKPENQGSRPSTKLDYALHFARYGRIFPLKPGAEEPLIANWQQVACGIEREKEIRATWAKCAENGKDVNIGLVLDDICIVECAEEQTQAVGNSLREFAPQDSKFLFAQRTPAGLIQLFIRTQSPIQLGLANVRVIGLGGYSTLAGSTIAEGDYTLISNAVESLGLAAKKTKKDGDPWGPRSKSKRLWALSNAYAGLRVHPLPENAKAPPMKNFGKEARNALTESGRRKVESWWATRSSGANIGVATGPGGDIIVIDVDTKNGKQGLASLERLEREYDLPQSYRVRTPTGGYHVYLRLPAGLYISNSVSWLPEGLDGIDIRGNAHQAYVLGAGSTIDGKKYAPIGSPKDIADCPEKLLELIRTVATDKPVRERESRVPACEVDTPHIIESATRWLKEDAPFALQGENGDDTTVRVAMCLSDMGVSESTALELMDEHWNRAPDEGGRADPPWGLDELAVKVRNGYTYAHNQPSCQAPVSPLDEFDAVDIPVDADPIDLWAGDSFPPDLAPGILPPALDRFVTDEAERKGVERGAVAVGALVACAAAIPSSFEVQVKQFDTGHKDRSILWGALVGPPAARKTPVLNEAIRPLMEIEKDWVKEDEPKRRTYAAAYEIWKKADPRTRGPEPKRPRKRRKIVNDTTVEALGPILSDNPDGVLSCNDELASWLGSMDAYKPGKAASKDQPFWLGAKQGNYYTVDRVTRDPIRVARAAVHVLGGIQPDVMRKYAPDLSGNGLLQRFLLVNMGPSKRAIDRAPDEMAACGWHGVIEMLAQLHDSDFVPVFRFSPEADFYRRQIEAFRDQLVLDVDTPPGLQGWIGKMESEWARIALVFHFLKWAGGPLGDVVPYREIIGADCAERAARFLIKWQHPHQRYFYQLVATSGATADADARNIAGFILAKGLTTITERDIYRSCSGLKAGDRRPARLSAMRTLETSGWVKPSKPHQCGQPPNKWTVNSAVHDGRFAKRAEIERQRREAVRLNIAATGAARRAAGGGEETESEAA